MYDNIYLDNKKELVELPTVIKRKLKFVAVTNMDEVVDLALLKPVKKRPSGWMSASARI